MIVHLLVAVGKAVLPALVVDGGRAIVCGVRRRRAAKRENQPSGNPGGLPAEDWLDQPLTPEEIATIRERLREPRAPLPEDPP